MEIQEVLKLTKEIAETTVREEVKDCDKNYSWHEKGMRALQQKKITGLVVSKDYGGLGFGLQELAKVCESLGEESASMGICFGMHCVGSAVINAKASRYQIENYLKPIAEGKHITTLTLSEPGTGAHFYYPQTTLMAVDQDNFVINGTKTFTTNGSKADSYVVSTVAADPDAPLGHFSCVLMDLGSEGLNWKGPWTGIGMRGNSSISAEINDVKVPKGNLLGEEGDQIWFVFSVVAPYFLVAMAGTYLGLANAAYKEAENHLKSRAHSHNGMSLASVQVLQYNLGKLWTELQSIKRLIYWACQEAEEGGELAIQGLCSAKAKVAGSAVKIVNDAMTICGGKGYRDGSNLERMLRDVRAADVMSPTTELLYTWIGRALLDQPILD